MEDCYKITRYSKGGSPVERLINLPLNKLFDEITVVNKVAEQEKAAIDRMR